MWRSSARRNDMYSSDGSELVSGPSRTSSFGRCHPRWSRHLIYKSTSSKDQILYHPSFRPSCPFLPIIWTAFLSCRVYRVCPIWPRPTPTCHTDHQLFPLTSLRLQIIVKSSPSLTGIEIQFWTCPKSSLTTRPVWRFKSSTMTDSAEWESENYVASFFAILSIFSSLHTALCAPCLMMSQMRIPSIAFWRLVERFFKSPFVVQ